jgi:hypothetical protein
LVTFALQWLGIRHAGMGLPTHPMVNYHLDSLTQLLPKVADFHIRAADWAMDPHVANYPKALNYFLAIYNGSCSEDNQLSRDEVYSYKRKFAEVLGYLGHDEDAFDIYRQLLADYPYDLTSLFMIRESYRSVILKTDPSSSFENEDLSFLSKQASMLYKVIESEFTSNYSGFKPAEKTWQPKRYNKLLSTIEFDDHIARREPFIISLGRELDQQLGWRTQQWRNQTYLFNKVSEKQKVQVEYQRYVADDHRMMGYGVGNHRKVVTFRDFLMKKDTSNLFQSYLNVQLEGLRRDLNPHLTPKLNLSTALPAYYSPPLNDLVTDIPLPSMFVDKDFTQVTMWINSPPDNCTYIKTVSRLHVDATDNLYVLLQGAKRFVVADPSQASRMKTILPTYAVASNGLSFRYNPVQYSLQGLESEHPKSFTQDIATGHFSSIESLENEPDILRHAIDLNEGDILYLPTGWFHQVRSTGCRHMAMNYWWKPPGWKGEHFLERIMFCYRS